MKPDTKNYYLALALSILVIFGWQYFYARPQFEKSRQIQQANQAQQAQQAQQSNAPQSPGRPGSASALPPQSLVAPSQGGVVPQSPAVRRDRKAVLADSPRISIDTPAIEGSIALKGGRLDDVALKDYRETPDKGSPNIVLLSPPGAPGAYYAESGFLPQPGAAEQPLPGPDTLWKSDGDGKLTPATPVTLTWDNGKGLLFTRKISVDKDYMFSIVNSVVNKTGAPITLTPFELVRREGTPPTSGYSILHEGFIGYVGDHEQEITYAGIEKEPGSASKASGTGGWAGITDKYWATAIVPDQADAVEAEYSAFGAKEKAYQTAMVEPAVTVAPAASATTASRLFAGAKVVGMLNDYEKTLGIKQFNLLIDWGYLWLITKPMFLLIDGIYKIVGNFGLAIIGVTFLVKLVFFPLANRSYMSMAKMKAVQPQLAALKEKYPDDKMRQQQEMMAIYKREKINPVAGCLPMLIQIPVFFALYKVLFVTIEMRQAPFYLWIRDLSQPDPTNVFNLFGLLPFNPTTLPVFGHFLAIGILPLIMGVSMFLQMKMNPEPPDPVQKTMFAWMPVIFTFMLGTFPSGLVLYWTVNNTLTILQQGVIMKRAGVKLELFDNLRGMFGGSKRAAPSPAKPPKPEREVDKPRSDGSKAPAE